MPSIYYVKKPSGFSQETDELLITPFSFQPTPKGVKTLCAYYSAKYGINLQSIDFRERIPQPHYQSPLQLFRYLADNPSLLEVAEGQSRGLILNHGENHSIPLLITRKEGKNFIICFDSTSGSSIKGYYKMAEALHHYEFYLNAGTRQADSTACITDSICILKEALQIDKLLNLIDSRVYLDHPTLRPTRFFAKLPPSNFRLFKMPEQLLVTAQLPSYVKEADMSVILRGGKTLKDYRSQFCITLSVFKGTDTELKNINSYLYIKSAKHRKIFDKLDLKNNEITMPGL